MNIRDTVKGMLFTFPTLYNNNPVKALVDLFTMANNWENGELCINGITYESTMKMDITTYNTASADIESLRSLHMGWKLQEKAILMQRQFIADNIDDILSSPLTNVYFGDDPRGYYFTKNISRYASAFHFPGNITKDWGDVLYKFLEYWLYRLNIEYGVSRGDIEDLHWWPKDVLSARDMILDARKRLHPLINNGQSYNDHEKTVYAMMTDMLGDMEGAQ